MEKESHTKLINLKYQLKHGMRSFNHLMDHSLHQIFKITLNISLKKQIYHKSIGQVLDISPKNFIFSKIFNSGFLYIEVWFTDQNSKPLEIEDKIDF